MCREGAGRARGRRAVLALVFLILAARLGADEVQLAPFAGFQFGGRVYSPAYQASFSLHESADFGATLDVPVAPRWRLEVLYSRQKTELRPRTSRAPRFAQTVEHYMAGIVEEPESDGPIRFFGVALLGATRLDPGVGGTDSEVRFALGLSLGAKVLASTHLGFRFEARGFYTVVESGGGLYCRGGCLFTFSGSGIGQGDVTAGLILRF